MRRTDKVQLTSSSDAQGWDGGDLVQEVINVRGGLFPRNEECVYIKLNNVPFSLLAIVNSYTGVC